MRACVVASAGTVCFLPEPGYRPGIAPVVYTGGGGCAGILRRFNFREEIGTMTSNADIARAMEENMEKAAGESKPKI